MESCGEKRKELVASTSREMSTDAEESEAPAAAQGTAEKYLHSVGTIAIVLFLLALAAV